MQRRDPSLNRGVIAGFKRLSQCSSNRIEVHVGRTCQNRCFIKQTHRFVASLKKFPELVVLQIRASANVLAQQTHPPRHIAQSQSNLRQPLSGSVSSQDIRNAFSIVNRLFKYGIASIDVLWFDAQVQGAAQRLDRARHKIEVQGRGGTNFQPVMDYLDEHRQYDGMLVFTDGYAPPPRPPTRNRRTRVVWLFNSENTWRTQHGALQSRGTTLRIYPPRDLGKDMTRGRVAPSLF